LINVRAETLRDRPPFKKDLLDRRCLVLADRFYEWRKDRKRKTPFRVLLKTGEPFAFAGIREINEKSDGLFFLVPSGRSSYALRACF
jgi:putative SOS response-associated peptidase YedK